MVDNEVDFERLREKYEKLYLQSKLDSQKEEGYYHALRRYGGLFTESKRKRLLSDERKSGRDRKNANFWYDVRETVKTGLIDLRLFLEIAGENNVTKVITTEDFGEVIHTLLYTSKAQATKAKIAQMMIEAGLRYIKGTSKFITQNQNRTIEDAIEISRQLAFFMLPESERNDPHFFRGGVA
jgi:hypothetical protein